MKNHDAQYSLPFFSFACPSGITSLFSHAAVL
jgi:hypothetical protein